MANTAEPLNYVCMLELEHTHSGDGLVMACNSVPLVQQCQITNRTGMHIVLACYHLKFYVSQNGSLAIFPMWTGETIASSLA